MFNISYEIIVLDTEDDIDLMESFIEELGINIVCPK